MKKKTPSNQKQLRESHAAGWILIVVGSLLLIVSIGTVPYVSGFILQAFGLASYAISALVIVYGLVRLSFAGKRPRTKGYAVKEITGLLAFSWVVGTVELLTLGYTREMEQYTSRFAGDLGSLLFRSLLKLFTLQASLFLSILILSLLISLIWRKQIVHLLREVGRIVFHAATPQTAENINSGNKRKVGKSKTVRNSTEHCPVCDAAGVAFAIAGGITLAGVLLNPRIAGSALFYTFGYLMYGLPAYLGWVGFTLISAQKTGKRVFEVVRVMLSFPILCWIVGSIELLIWYTGGKETLALAAGSIGVFPFSFLNNFTSGLWTLLSALGLVLAAALLVLLPLILRVLKQLSCWRIYKKVPRLNTPNPSAAQYSTQVENPGRSVKATALTDTKKPAPDMNSAFGVEGEPAAEQLTPVVESAEKEKRIPDSKNIPLPVSILPDLPVITDPIGGEARKELLEIEETLIDVIFRLTQIRLERAPGREPVMGISTMQLAFRPHEANRKAIKNLLNLNYDLALELKRSPVRITLKDVIMIEIPLDEEKRTFVYVKELLDREETITEPTYLIGKTADGRQLELPVKKSLNVLIGGQVGAGKSVLLHSLIFGIIFRWKPSEVQFALYDHKVEEFKRYSRLPHLWHPVANSSSKFTILLEKLEQELERRKRARERDEQATFSLLIVIMDEFRGLSSERLMTLVAECRSLNMTFVLATQYPRADVISTPIKANLTTGISFRMRDATGSRLIIGESGGEMLLGNGDCLVSTSFCFEHAQAALCRREDLQAVGEYLKTL